MFFVFDWKTGLQFEKNRTYTLLYHKTNKIQYTIGSLYIKECKSANVHSAIREQLFDKRNIQDCIFSPLTK